MQLLCYSAILYSLSKQALTMRAFKLARQILTKLQQLRIPSEYQVVLFTYNQNTYKVYFFLSLHYSRTM